MGERASALRDIDLERARFAFDKIKSVSNWNDKSKRELRSYLVKLPTLIMNNGLVMTLAFIKSKVDENKKEDAYELIYKAILTKWIENHGGSFGKKLNGEDLLEFVLNLSPEELLYLTQEFMRLAEWLKRIAEAELPSGLSSE